MDNEVLPKPRLRRDQAAQFCGLSLSTLAKRLAEGTGPAYSRVGKLYLFDVDDLVRWLEANKSAHCPVTASALIEPSRHRSVARDLAGEEPDEHVSATAKR